MLLSFILSVVGVVVLTLAGSLGGEPICKHGVAVTAAAQTTPQQPEAHRHIGAVSDFRA
jgi:uncharacterized membrane protein